MLFKRLLFAGLFFICTSASAQKIKSQLTFRILKTATSLLEAQQFEAAEQYFRNGLQKAIQFQDMYCQAFANEGLGNYFAKTEQPDSAAVYYKKAIKLYRSQNLNVISNVVESLLKSVQGIGDLYAGIEVGAKGVKLSIIEVMLNKDKQYAYTLKMDTSINTDAASLSYQSEKETRDAVAKLLSISTGRYAVPTKRIYVVISSGVKQELDKYEKLDYFTGVIRPKDMDTSIKVKYITAEQESELSFLGIVPQQNRYTQNQLDVGSGNTKGGYFDRTKKFVPVTLPFGTKSFQRLVETKTSGTLDAFVTAAEKVFKDSLAKLMIDELVSKPDFKAREVMYLSGGIVWTIASFMHPQNAALNNYTEISSADITACRKRILSDYNSLVHPDLSFIKDRAQADAAEKNLVRARNTYDQKALLAGVIWLDELVKQINVITPDKKFLFPKYAYVGWISGYIVKKVNQQFLQLPD
jgi:hypothetical protein